MPERASDRRRAALGAAAPGDAAWGRHQVGWPLGLALAGVVLGVMPAAGQTIADTAREIEAMVDFTGSAIVDGDVVEEVDWRGSGEDCSYEIMLRGSTEAGNLRTEFATTLDFRNVEALRVAAAALGPEAVRVTLRPKDEAFPTFARVESMTEGSAGLAEWQESLARDGVAGDCSGLACALSGTTEVATVIVLNPAEGAADAQIARPFKLLALLCEAAPQN